MNASAAILSIDDSILFRTSAGMVVDDLHRYVKAWLAEHPKGRIYIGSDSQVRGTIVKYSTVVCLWDVGHGVWEAYSTVKVPRFKDRFSRLWNEVQRSLEVAELIRDLGDVTVHMDFNSDPKFPSYQLYDAGMGLVKSMGFEAAGKPHSWAATCGANRHCQ
ncbi:ribonuclease H-like YkuK family protein [Phaeocystidibacter marisrubri]|uniref:Uncharacterized protein n=1 Tax=Phaeocystidibacter marisrubri TaxID=1577780 RepID=A0A6L3ZGM9_9FLAO|nr:ribonuclease H-like YkuK family protein [Phaeocystidibacter marisrubri]KAB2816494.1 hypothetical protein F8C82_12495 [Phaeocystidibacter marisrubri]GGH69336.1 hypothetical protein GCM10011318_10250 [Phaeocystidibacter marisrubri]